MLEGMNVYVVEPGTEIEYNGEKRTVSETEAVFRGPNIYMTQRHYVALKAHPDVKTMEPRDE